MASANWKWPIPGRQLLAGTAGRLTFVGGAGDFDAKGKVRHGGDLQAQVAGSMANLAGALEIEGCGLADVVRLKVFYKSDGTVDEWEILEALARHLEEDPLQAITLHPVPLQPFAGRPCRSRPSPFAAGAKPPTIASSRAMFPRSIG